MFSGFKFVFSRSFFLPRNSFPPTVAGPGSIEVTWQIERATISNKKLIYNASCQSSRNEGAISSCTASITSFSADVSIGEL